MRKSIEIDDKSCSVTHTLHTLHNTEKKEPRSIRMRPSHYKAISNYARLSDVTVGDVVVNACFLLMDVEPVEGSVFIVERPPRNNNKNIQSEIQEFICVDEMREFVIRLDKDDPDNQQLLKIRRQSFVKLLKDCNKVKIWGDELSALVMQARSHFE